MIQTVIKYKSERCHTKCSYASACQHDVQSFGFLMVVAHKVVKSKPVHKTYTPAQAKCGYDPEVDIILYITGRAEQFVQEGDR